MRRLTISSSPAVSSKRQPSSSCTSGMGNGQSSAPTSSVVRLSAFTSLWDWLYASTKRAPAARSATGSPESINEVAPEPNRSNSDFGSPLLTASASAWAASSAVAKCFCLGASAYAGQPRNTTRASAAMTRAWSLILARVLIGASTIRQDGSSPASAATTAAATTAAAAAIAAEVGGALPAGTTAVAVGARTRAVPHVLKRTAASRLRGPTVPGAGVGALGLRARLVAGPTAGLGTRLIAGTAGRLRAWGIRPRVAGIPSGVAGTPLIAALHVTPDLFGAAGHLPLSLLGAPTERFARRRIPLRGLPVALPARRVAVPHPLPVVDVVLPIAVADVGLIEVVVVVHVDVDVVVPVAAPTAVAPERRADSHAGTKRQQRGGGDVPGWVIGVGWIARGRPGTVHHGGVVRRHVNHLRVRRLVLDDGGLRRCSLGCRCIRRRRRCRFDGDRLLLGALEIACLFRHEAQALDRVHHVILLGQEGIAELLGPVELVVHHGEHRRKRGQRLYTWIPALLLEGILQGLVLEGGVLLLPARRFDDFERIGGRHQDLRQQRVGIEGNGRDDLLDFLRLEYGRLRGRRLRRCCLGQRRGF